MRDWFIIVCVQRTGGYHKYVDYGKSITEQATNSCAFMAGK